MNPAAPALQLDAATIDAIARRVVELQQVLAPSPVLSVAEAMAFVGCRSTSAFDRWVQKWAPNSRCSQGHYTRAALSRGRDAQARSFGPKRKKKTKSVDHEKQEIAA